MGGSRIIIFLLLSFIITIAVWQGFFDKHSPNPEQIDYYNSEEENIVEVIGQISDEPDIRRNKTNYTIRTNSILISDSPIPVSGQILISTNKYPKYNYGDNLKITGRLRSPPVFDSFDYAGYLSRYEIYSVMYYPRIKNRSTNKEIRKDPSGRFFSNFKFRISNLKRWFFTQMLTLKSSFEYQMNRTFATEPSSSFLAGLLLGSRKGIPPDLTQDFQTTGLTHIIAISGYNITIIVTLLMSIFRPLGRKPAIYISAGGVILFTFFVGASPAVVRACVMGLIALIALNSERQTHTLLTLILTAALMIGYNPKILFHDLGFQLSFLATVGLIYISPLLKPYLNWLPRQLAIRDSVLLCLSAQIMALPVILFNFQKFPLISPLANLLIAGPIIPLAMLFGFLSTMISFIYLPLAKLVAYPAYLLLNYIVQIAHLTAKIPYASLEITWFSKPLLVGYFLILSLFLIRSWRLIRRRERRILATQLRLSHKIFTLIHVDK